MAFPLVWPKKNFFYPVGNTPPVCLTQDLAPEENANILLLGCGDPRHILFTICNDLSSGKDVRKLDITCCDWEPAILARNIVLLTMAADGIPSTSAWAIFYHFFLNEIDYDFMRFQCQQLLACSTNTNTWNSSNYGRYIRFSTEHTLFEVRRHWSLYAGFNDLHESEKKAIRLTFITGMKSVLTEHRASNCFRAAGPLCLFLNKVADKSHTAFWATGIVGEPQVGSDARSKISSIQHMNPMFVYSRSGNKFNVHYGTDPLAAFHLSPAAAGADVQNGQPNSLPHEIDLSETARVAKTQFDLWCLSFKERVFANSAEPELVIRFHAGDAIAFARALHTCQQNNATQSGIYTSQWGGSQIILDGSDYNADNAYSAPVSFNVIDTSNLTDHLGLINILIAAVPLLQQKPWAVLHTNTLAPRNRSQTLSSLALGDLPTLSLLLGVAPTICRSHFTTISNKHELFISSHISESLYNQLHGHMSWKPLLSVPVSPIKEFATCNNQSGCPIWDAAGLARFFFSLYLQMFKDENMHLAMQNISLTQLSQPVLYTRESLVALLQLVKERAELDWDQFMDVFNHLLVDDCQLLLGRNNYQDFICHLHLRNVYTKQSLDTDLFCGLLGVHNRGVFQGWKDVPPVVCVVLKVPRRRLKILEDMNSDVILTPSLQCQTQGPNFENIHSSIRPIFGNAVLSMAHGELSINIYEDLRGWEGDSDLIVTFFMPSWIPLRHPLDSFHVGLFIKSTPQSVLTLVPKLGLLLNVYMTNASNSSNVWFVRSRPNNDILDTTPLHVRRPSTPSIDKPREQIMVNLNPAGTKVTTITVRDNIPDSPAKINLFQGASVVARAIADNVLRVDFKDYMKNFVYPFPIVFDHMKVRIARRSSYIEIEVPVRPEFEDSYFRSLDLFPMASDEKLPATLLNIHYLHLDKLPVLQTPVGRAMDAYWMSIHLGMSLSNREQDSAKLGHQSQHRLLCNLKRSINCIFFRHVTSEHRPRVFCLRNPDANGVGLYALIFLCEIRLDLSAQTIVADACVVPLCDALRPRIAKDLTKLSIVTIDTLDDETFAWMKLLPALAERCRTWKHSDQCEYLQEGSMAGLKAHKSGPLCSCGKGKNLGPFLKVTDWTSFQPEATRIAISPLFTHSEEYDILRQLPNYIKNKTSKSPSQSAAQSSLRPKSTACASCGKSDAPSVCSKCKAVRYCSSSCQKSHWKAHKLDCTTS